MQNLSTELFTVTNNVKNDFHTIKPVLELYMGLRWEDWMCCDCYHYSIELGWEEQWWANENQFFSVEPLVIVNNGPNRSRLTESRLGDLIMQGLTVKVRFDF